MCQDFRIKENIAHLNFWSNITRTVMNLIEIKHKNRWTPTAETQNYQQTAAVAQWQWRPCAQQNSPIHPSILLTSDTSKRRLTTSRFASRLSPPESSAIISKIQHLRFSIDFFSGDAIYKRPPPRTTQRLAPILSSLVFCWYFFSVFYLFMKF